MHKGLAAFIHGPGDLVTDTDAAKWEIARGNCFCKLDQVGFDAPMLQSKHRAGATETGDHLIGD